MKQLLQALLAPNGRIFTTVEVVKHGAHEWGVPCLRCQVAHVCRKSYHLKSLIPARFKAFLHAVVFTELNGSPLYVKTRSGCLLRCSCRTSQAFLFNGTPRSCDSWIYRFERKHVDSQSQFEPIPFLQRYLVVNLLRAML